MGKRMNLWITKNIKFGYRYTTNKSIRKIITEYFDNYLLNLLSTKGSSSDKFIIVGGIFSNTNPSIIAISDAYNYLTKISNMMNVVLIPTQNDIRYFDGNTYSTLSLFKDINNIEIKEYSNNNFISYGNCIIEYNTNKIKILDNEFDIPNAIQFDENDGKCGIFVNRIIDDKYILITNKYSPKHMMYEINTFNDIKSIKKDNNLIHLIIDNNLFEENKTLLNIEIFRLNPVSIRYKNQKKDKKNKLIEDFNIKRKILETIGDDNKLNQQFQRILDISKKQI